MVMNLSVYVQSCMLFVFKPLALISAVRVSIMEKSVWVPLGISVQRKQLVSSRLENIIYYLLNRQIIETMSFHVGRSGF